MGFALGGSFVWATAGPAGQPNESTWGWLTHEAVGFFTLWLVIIAGGQLILFFWQLILIRESLNDTKLAAEAAKASADAARDSVNEAKFSNAARDRAYVHFNGCRYISHRSDELSPVFWRLRPRWINSGNTPPRNLRIYTHYELLEHPLPNDYEFTPEEHQPTSALLAPKAELEGGFRDIDGADLVAVKEGRKFLYVWGDARYRDVFPYTPERVTKFCAFARVVTGDPTAPWHSERNKMEIAFGVYERHNCADEECGE